MMIDYTLDETNSVLHVHPTSPLRRDDFARRVTGSSQVNKSFLLE